MKFNQIFLICLFLIAQVGVPLSVAAGEKNIDKEKHMTNAPMEEPRRTFKQRYPNPVISKPRSTAVPGLEMVTVYDKSELVKDPLIPENWLKLRDGTMLEVNPGNILTALNRLKFTPKNDTNAVGAARIYFDGSASIRHRILMENGEAFPSAAETASYPGAGKLGIKKPSAVPEGKNYRVTLYVLSFPHAERYFNSNAKEYISKFEILVGPGVYKIISGTDLWPEEGRLGLKSGIKTKPETPPEAPRLSFKGLYPNPIISQPRKTIVPGLEMVFVYDRSQAAEDPLIPTAWFKLKGGEMLEFSQESILSAMQKAKFAPKNPAEAIETARIYIEHSYNQQDTILMENGAPFPAAGKTDQFPGVEKLGLTKPTAVPDGKNFIVTLYVMTDPKNERWFNKNAKPFISKYVFQIGHGVYQIYGSSVIWPEGDMNRNIKIRADNKSEETDSMKEKNIVVSGGEKKRVGLKESVQVGSLRVTFEGITIEESVRPDGGFAGSAVTAELKLAAGEGGESQVKIWNTPYMMDYKKTIKEEPETVSLEFLKYRLRIVAADFDSNSPWLELQIKKTE